MNLPEPLKAKLRELPDEPGCYVMRDRRGRIIYVGKAVSLRQRVQSYFRQATLRSAAPKLRGLVKSVHDLDVIVVHNEAAAVLTEGRLIKEYQPRYNVSFRDDKRFLLLRADPDQPLPRLRLVRLRQNDAARYFGPYASSHAARATLDFVEKRFGLRKCPPERPDADTYRHCINDIVRYCAAPCIGRVSPGAYRARCDEACAFLRGERPAVLKELRAKMAQAAATLDYERAAALRDTLLALDATVRQRARVAPTPALERHAGLAGVAELQRVLRLPSAPHTIEAYDISNISGTYAVGSLVCSADGIPQRNRYRRFRIRTVEGSDDVAMMAEVIRRRFRRGRREGRPPPDLVLLDGGRPQLHAARGELRRLGLGALPCAALAKRLEEIHRDEIGPPVRLPRDSPALKVLQRIRDEAHRFALTYHRHLRGRLIRESVLDEVPGVGPKRKRLLLERFGSVRRLAQAGAEEIARAAPGIGLDAARAVKRAVGGAPSV